MVALRGVVSSKLGEDVAFMGAKVSSSLAIGFDMFLVLAFSYFTMPKVLSRPLGTVFEEFAAFAIVALVLGCTAGFISWLEARKAPRPCFSFKIPVWREDKLVFVLSVPEGEGIVVAEWWVLDFLS